MNAPHPHRALLRSVERPVVVQLSRLLNALGWLFAAAIVIGYALGKVTA